MNPYHTKSFDTKWLEGVRGLAILWIAWYHIDLMILPPNHEIFNIRSLATLGFAGVNVFLLASGFGLAFSMTRNQIKYSLPWSKLSWQNFFIRRLSRIYPLYIFAHILFFLLGAAVGKYADMPLDIGFLLSITGLRVFFPKYFWYGPDAFWFIGLILQLYILFPLLFWLLGKTGQLKFVIIIFTLCAVSRLLTAPLDNAYDLMLGLASNRIAEFGLGMAFGYGTAINKGLQLSFVSLNNKFFWIVSILSLTVGGLLFWGANSPVRIVSLDLVLGIAWFTVLAILVLLSIHIAYIYKLLISLGSISYSFYLLHSPPIRPAFAGLAAIGIKNFFIATILYLIIIGIFSFLLTQLESAILSKSQFGMKTTNEINQ